MAQLKLQVAGVGYDGAPAGTGGETFLANEDGAQGDKVFYKISSGGGISGAVKELLFEKVHAAYLGAQDRSSLDNLSVLYSSEDEVKRAGMSNYVLWLAK